MSSPPILYDRDTLHTLPWPDSAQAVAARRYLEPLVREGALHFVGNAPVDVYALHLDDVVLPVTVSSPGHAACWPCSPYTQYLRYARTELRLVEPAIARLALQATTVPLSLGLRAAQIDRVVQVGNQMFSTNLLPALRSDQVRQIARLVERFPQHALIVRTLTHDLDGPILTELHALGARLLPSRQVYLVDPAARATWKSKTRWLLKRDEKLIGRSGYTVVRGDALTASDVPRIAALYRQLYLEKYSPFNVDFTEAFFALSLAEGTLEIVALRKDGRIDAVLGYTASHQALTAPVFGFDTSLPIEVGLYRMLSVLILREAERLGLVLHASAGAAEFKRNRGAQPTIERHAVFVDHLPAPRRAVWAGLSSALERWGVPLVQARGL